MTSGALLKQKQSFTDPNDAQRRAADPTRSVWVGASAGSGKTKVLTDRVLRLLLPREDGSPGTQPHRILCLTFTKSAAGEMRLRLSARLSEWAVMDEIKLDENLAALLGRPPKGDEIHAARGLFAAVIDAPGGLNIMTIHAFCQSVLGRFPLEAGLPPHFEALDESAAALLFSRARNDIMAQARRAHGSDLGRALHALAAVTAEDGFEKLMQDVAGESRTFRELLNQHGGLDKTDALTRTTLGLAPGEDEDTVLLVACRDNMFDERGLRESVRILSECGTDATDRPAADAIQKWLDTAAEQRVLLWDAYRDAFLTQQGTARKNLPTKKPQAAFPDIVNILATESDRVIKAEERRKCARCAALTHHLLVLGDAILNNYEKLKSDRAALDFNDLINKTLTLLEKRDMASWVMFKLDGGLDHILVDEAQDTNPEQWRIIAALCDDFFSGEGARADAGRTVFAVGDEKQSIYSFQRAAPEKFSAMRAFFSERIQSAGRRLAQEDMNISFRSVPAVLNAVDAVFVNDDVRAGLGAIPLKHESFRTGHGGLVEAWPLFTTPDKENRDAWEPPVVVRAAQGGGARLAEHIGETIQSWLQTDEMLPARGRAVQPGDIMILVRRRSAFIGQMVRALKTRGIPVGGADRMVLKEQLAVQDLVAAAQFALLPSDDLSLACLLKSPFIGWDDAALEKIAAQRSGTLWDQLRNVSNCDIVKYLENLIGCVQANRRPYEFFSALLQLPCPADQTSGWHAVTGRLGIEAIDPIEEFISAALSFESDNLSTLQDFILQFMQNDSEIKREQEASGGRVRIMTVHGAKGLQAPIVILPDTTRVTLSAPGNVSQRLIWPDKSGLAVPLWSPRKDADCALYGRALSALEAKQNEEYRRLLYVAMTRAEDRLYVCGHTGRKTAINDSWYTYITAALKTMTGIETAAFTGQDDPLLRLRGEQIITPKHDNRLGTAALTDAAGSGNDPQWHWLYAPAVAEFAAPAAVTPSRAASGPAAMPVFSPLAAADTYRFRRGNITHRLLQHLPDIPESQRLSAAATFVKRHAVDLPDNIRAGIVREVMTILENPAFAPLFGANSLAEVPVAGTVNGAPASGQIDRLLVTDSEVWITDYKTNRPPPADETHVPAAYREQMKYYSDIVSKIYIGRRVRSFLLWTDGPRMMEIR